MKKLLPATIAIVADVGATFLVSAALFACAVAVIEYFGPGLAASAVAPQTLAAFAAACCAAALVVREAPRSWFARIGHALAGLAITGFAGWASSAYFASVTDGGWLAAAVTGITALLFLATAVTIPEEV